MENIQQIRKYLITIATFLFNHFTCIVRVVIQECSTIDIGDLAHACDVGSSTAHAACVISGKRRHLSRVRVLYWGNVCSGIVFWRQRCTVN